MKRKISWKGVMVFALLAAACSVNYIGPGPVPLTLVIENANTHGEIKIIRDADYVVHVLANSEEDLYYGVGFAMAQDRFGMLDILRRAATGRLSEWLGDPFSYKGISLPTMDVFMKTFRFWESAVEGYAMMDPKSRKLLDAFSEGINRFLVEKGDKPIFGYDPDYRPDWWTPEDSLAVAGLMGLSMTIDCLFEEYYYDRLEAEIGRERLADWLPHYPEDAPIIVASKSNGKNSLPPEFISSLRVFFREIIALPIGSNNWVVSGSRTKSGKAILANDPHVPLFQIPTFWYHCHLKGAGIDVAGMMFPGFPGFGAGSNKKIAWGLTNAMADYIDLYREKVNPNNPNLYLYKERWENFRRVSGVVKVRGKKPINYTYRVSRHGPIIETGMAGRYKIRSWAPYEVIAMKFVDMFMGHVADGYFKLTHANDWHSFREASRLIAMGPFGWNHVYADVNGNIGYQTVANVPIRMDNQGILMHRGWTGEEEWDGYIPFDQLPRSYNPPKGYILSANNRIQEDGYPYYISNTYLPYRATRIAEFLASHPSTTVEDIMALQADVVDVRARKLVPYILEDLKSLNSDGRYEDAIKFLEEYAREGFQSRIDLVGPSIYYLFMSFLPEFIVSDEIGEDLASTLSGSGLPLVNDFVDKIFSNPDSVWFDDVHTPRRERRADITALTMDKVIKYLKGKFGREPQRWTWGSLHKLTLNSPLAAFFYLRNKEKMKRGPYPYPGNIETVNAAACIFVKQWGYRVIGGPSSRLIVDFANPDRIYLSASTGMSANPDDPHYDNLTDTWLKNKYLPLWFDEKSFTENNKGVIIIKP